MSSTNEDESKTSSAPSREIWRSDYRHVANHLATVFLTLALGIAPLVWAADSWTAASLTTMRESPGGMTAWGIAITIGGVWLLGAMGLSTRAVRWALVATGATHLFVAFTFALSQSTVDGASPWGWMLFGGLALRHAMQALWFPRQAPPRSAQT